MTHLDREACKRAIAMAQAEGEGRREQIDAMLAEEGFEYAGKFAVYCCQTRTLGLKPWEMPPCHVVEEPEADPNRHGLFEAWGYRRRLEAAGLSVFEPDPIGALTALEARPPAA